jgi:signal-transduction protein with cAMP-binding, CBS, and nucleotidyltransferase domain/DNA polymerase III epsilon subunit-like protein
VQRASALSLLAPLRAHAPFDEMEPEALQFLSSHVAIAYYPRGTLIVGPEAGPVDRLYIVKQGRVAADGVLGEGECFPVGALIGRRATTHDYRAEADTFCWELPADHFHALLERSARFREFCTSHLAALLGRAHARLRAEAGAAVLEGAGMLAPLNSVLRRAPVSCPPEAPLHEVTQRMHEARIGSMLIVDAGGVPVGIFTNVDVLRTAAARIAQETPIGELMSRDPVALEEEATLADAALAMARHGIRHVIVTRDGRVAGVVSERDLFALQRIGLRRTAGRIHSAQAPAELAAAGADIRRLAHQLLAQGVGAETLTAMVSALNDALTRRMIELAARSLRLPAAWCWLALGSEGRMEQTFVTDQDNALIYAGEQGALLELADEVNRGLDAAGFPLCRGGIMARNPRWCLSAREWRAVFDGWIRNNELDPQQRSRSAAALEHLLRFAAAGRRCPVGGRAACRGTRADARHAELLPRDGGHRACHPAAARPDRRFRRRRARPQAARRTSVRGRRARPGARRRLRRDRHRGAAARRGRARRGGCVLLRPVAAAAARVEQRAGRRAEPHRAARAEGSLPPGRRPAGPPAARLPAMKWFRRTALAQARWVVIDCETSGLDAARDRLLSVGAVRVAGSRIELGGSLHAFVRQALPSAPENILVHGITGDAQLAGRPVEEVREELQRLVGEGIPVAFHARFDETVLRRHGLRLRRNWVDLATLCPALFPRHSPRGSSLDHWLAAFDIPPDGRHDALGDAFAAAQLLLVALKEADRQRIRSLEALLKLQRDIRWTGS